MHKNFSKIVAGSLMSAAMLATSVTSVLAPMSASAGDQLGQSTFDEGIGLPWHTCETNPAKQTFNIEGGTYNVTIVNNDGPESRWDLQLRHRGLHIESGHTYKIHWEVEASTAGQLYTKIGNYSGKVEVWHNNCTGQSDFNNTWNCVTINAGKNKFDATFTASETVDVAEWAFHYGGKGEYQDVDCFPNNTVLKFDNLTLEDTTSNEFDFDKTNEFGVIRPKSNVRLNQVGYFKGLNKKASYVTDATSPLDFEVRDASGKAVYTGKTTVFGADPDSGTSSTEQVTLGDETVTKSKDSGSNVHIIDFSDFQEEGTYTIFVKDTTGVSGTKSGLREGAYDTTIDGDKVMWHNWVTDIDYVMNQSAEFKISNSIYDGVLRDSLNYYYQNRSGVPIEEAYITSGDKSTLAHSQYGHNPDTAYVQPKWQKSYSSVFDGDKSYSIDGTGGWYDAGDHGKYVVNGGISVWTLQNAYEFSKHIGTDAKWTADAMSIPESGNNTPDILDEARVELEWMFKMMVKSSDPTWGKYENMVYHKLHDHKWTGLAVHAWAYEGFEDCTRIVKPPTYAATLNLAAVAAQAARLWKGIDDTFATECEKNAIAAYKAVKDSGNGWNTDKGNADTDPLFAPLDQAIGGGAYGDTYVLDDMYWAACELYITTGDEQYLKDLEGYKNNNDSTGNDKAYSLTSNLGGGENNGSFSSFNWGCTSGLGTLSLYLNKNKIAAHASEVEASIKTAADAYMEEQAGQGMGIPYHSATFTDPVNIGSDKSGKPIEITGYEWGSNSFVVNNAMVMAYAYDSTKDTKYVNGASESLDYIYGRNGLDFSYVSGYGETTLTYPHHRFWAHGVDKEFPYAPSGVLSGGPGAGMQDPYIGGLGYKRGTLANQKCYVDNAEAWSVNEVTINWNAPLAWMTSFMDDVAPTIGSTPSTEATWGDANLDSKVTLADCVAVLQHIANKEKYGLEPQGLINADVNNNGDGVTGQDALTIQKVDSGVYKQSELPIGGIGIGK